MGLLSNTNGFIGRVDLLPGFPGPTLESRSRDVGWEVPQLRGWTRHP